MKTSETFPIRQVLRGLSLNREPGWNFPGNFLELSFDRIEPDRAELSLETGAHCEAANGGVCTAAICVLADIAMGAALRTSVGFEQRMATVQMSLSFTGAPMRGLVRASSVAQLQTAGAGAPQRFSRTTIEAGGAAACVGTAGFIALGNTERLATMPLRKRSDGLPVTALSPADLEPEEAAVLQLAREADSGAAGFLDRFWGLQPKAVPGGAECTFRTGLHVGNRVGHTQGGISLALAAETARAAAGPGWHLSNITGWYIAPGRGEYLQASARPLHSGSRTAAMLCETRDAGGRLVMHAVSAHARMHASLPASQSRAG